MMLLNTSLLRERFTITSTDGAHEPILALGNRILLPLVSKNGAIKERIIIRAHSMHMALMMAARITSDFLEKGPIVNLYTAEKWKETWFDISHDFERPHTPDTWICVYHNGRPLYQEGYHHPFLDIIEQCDVKNREEYDRAIPLAVDIFKQAGREVQVNYEVNIAAVIGVTDAKTRCGLILRSPQHTSTFNFSMQENPEKNFIPLPHHGLELAAYYLEAIQLSVFAAFIEKKLRDAQLRETTEEAIKARASYKRIGRLNREIEAYESMYDIRYRPEKPDFRHLARVGDE